MNDSELIQELREQMRAQTDHTEVPSGFIDQARRTARRRSARRVAAAGTPLLAAAGVATVLVTSGGSHSPSSHGHQTASRPSVGAHFHDTAYIVRQVRAQLASAGQNDVRETVETGGNGNVTATEWQYTEPDSGMEYTSSTLVSSSDVDVYDQFIVGTPDGNQVSYKATDLAPVQHLYAVGADDVGPATPNSADDAAQIRSELASGQVSPSGTATVNGQQTLKLSFTDATGARGTLYVDPQTYAPVQSVSTSDAGTQYPDTTTETWRPATSANIANTQLTQIPSGYTQVSQATLKKDNPAGR